MTESTGIEQNPFGVSFSLNLKGSGQDSRFYGDLPASVQYSIDKIAREILDPENGHCIIIGYKNAGKSFLIEQFAANVDHYLGRSKLDNLFVIDVSRADANLIEQIPNGVINYISAVSARLQTESSNICLVTESVEFAGAIYAHDKEIKVILELNQATYPHLLSRENQGVSKIWSSWGKIDANEVFLTPEELASSLTDIMAPKLSNSGLYDLTEEEISHLIDHFLNDIPELVFTIEGENAAETEEIKSLPEYGKVIIPPGFWGLSVRKLASTLAYSSDSKLLNEAGEKDICLAIDSVFGEVQEELEEIFNALTEEQHDLNTFSLPFPFNNMGPEVQVFHMCAGHDHDDEEENERDSTPLAFQDIFTLEKRLKTTVMGQDESVKKVVDSLTVPAAGLHDCTKPLRSFLFLGPTGVGKTQLGLSLANQLSNEPMHVIRLDMSEYGQAHEASKLLGAPSGYVGYEEGGVLTNAVYDNPKSLIILDEVEKGHPKIWDSFLQIFDAGRMTDNKGRVVDFSQTVIVMTSNIGARESLGHDLGFSSAEDKAQRAQQAVLNEVEKYFRPEFFNRIDEVVFFTPLSQDTAREIVRREISLVSDRMKPNGFKLSKYENDVVDEIIKLSKFSKYGARDIQRAVLKNISQPLAMRMLSKTQRRKTITIGLGQDNKIQVQ